MTAIVARREPTPENQPGAAEPEVFPGANLMSESRRRKVLEQAAEIKMRVMPPVTCYAFCTEQDGHPGLFHTEDQTCYSTHSRVPTVMYPPRKVGSNYEQEFFAIYLEALHNGEQPMIQVEVQDRVVIVMSLDEALAVTQAIVGLLDDATAAGLL